MSSGVGCRYGLDPMLLWLWGRAAAAAPIQPLAWEPHYAMGAALKSKNIIITIIIKKSGISLGCYACRETLKSSCNRGMGFYGEERKLCRALVHI